MPRGVYQRKPGLRRNQPATALAERFWPKVDKTATCWIWTAFADKAGYGRIQEGRRGGVVLYAHRVSYEWAHGPIPEGKEIDHLCRNRRCVNPDHLEAVPHRVNALRGVAPMILWHLVGVCQNGHPRSEAVLRKGTNKVVSCKVCRREKYRNARLAVIAAREERRCVQCGGVIDPSRRSDAKFCSTWCRYAWHHRSTVSGASPRSGSSAGLESSALPPSADD